MGAGTGIWARLLSDAGVKVTAVDNNSGGYRWDVPTGKYYRVKQIDGAKAAHRYTRHKALMLCWPDYAVSMAAKAIASFGGDRVVYIGEGSGGCTGDDKFHKILDEKWELVDTLLIPQWPGIHDDVEFYKRR